MYMMFIIIKYHIHNTLLLLYYIIVFPYVVPLLALIPRFKVLYLLLLLLSMLCIVIQLLCRSLPSIPGSK